VFGINDVPVMGYGNGIGTLTDNNGLDIGYAVGTPGGVAIMTYGKITAELAQGIFGKHLGDQPQLGANL
jgi:hypothetical protein